jgi:hypothetical protein
MQSKRNQLLTALSLQHNREGLIAVNSVVTRFTAATQEATGWKTEPFSEQDSFFRSQKLLNELKKSQPKFYRPL